MADSLGVQDERRYKGQNQIYRNLNRRVNQHILKAAPQSLILECSGEVVEARECGTAEKGLLEEARLKRVEHRDVMPNRKTNTYGRQYNMPMYSRFGLRIPEVSGFCRCIYHSFSLSS